MPRRSYPPPKDAKEAHKQLLEKLAREAYEEMAREAYEEMAARSRPEIAFEFRAEGSNLRFVFRVHSWGAHGERLTPEWDPYPGLASLLEAEKPGLGSKILRAIFAFMDGVSSVLNLNPMQLRKSTMLEPDFDALHRDWNAVGGDLRAVTLHAPRKRSAEKSP